MKHLEYDAVVIGGGAAGLGAASEIKSGGFSVLIIEREEHLGGILTQCIHNGFGLHEFKEELTGPEYAERYADIITKADIPCLLNTTVTDLDNEEGHKIIHAINMDDGIIEIKAKTVILAMGCRERNRGNIGIPGSRPAGVFTAGLAQRLVNMEGYLPGKDVVIVGSGDIGLIMARRMTWVGAKVHAVIEIMPYPSGLTRNIVQCLNDFKIPLYLSHIVTKIGGKKRVDSVEVSPMENGSPDVSKSFNIPCDTLLLSVGLVPENELSKKLGVEINLMTNGPIVDSSMMTNIDGVFATGNVLHVHDLVDFVTEESKRTGQYVVDYLNNKKPEKQIKIKPGSNVRYVNPTKCMPDRDNKIYMRTMIVKNGAELNVYLGEKIILTKKLRHIHPAEMINITLGPDALQEAASSDFPLEVSIK